MFWVYGGSGDVVGDWWWGGGRGFGIYCVLRGFLFVVYVLVAWYGMYREEVERVKGGGGVYYTFSFGVRLFFLSF